MIGKLVYFEITKKWRSSKNLLLGYVGIQALILLITRLFLWNGNIAIELTGKGASGTNNVSLPFALTMTLFFVLALFLGAFPFIEGIYRFERDLSGKQAYLELMIPAVSWKKVLAKLIATLCSLIVCGTVSLLSMLLFFVINANSGTEIYNAIKMCVEFISKEWLQLVMILLYMLFSFASIFMIIFACISTAKAFTHKNTVAVPIGILAFLLVSGLTGALGVQLDKIPLVNFSVLQIEMSLSRMLADILVFFAAMAATSWLMEKKIEH